MSISHPKKHKTRREAGLAQAFVCNNLSEFSITHERSIANRTRLSSGKREVIHKFLLCARIIGCVPDSRLCFRAKEESPNIYPEINRGNA